MCTQYLHHVHPHTTFPTSSPLPQVSTPPGRISSIAHNFYFLENIFLDFFVWEVLWPLFLRNCSVTWYLLHFLFSAFCNSSDDVNISSRHWVCHMAEVVCILYSRNTLCNFVLDRIIMPISHKRKLSHRKPDLSSDWKLSYYCFF
jgi:hypothetical protein